MQLFYTTTTGYNDLQTNPNSSLGGFKAGTPVANDDYSNLFDEISVQTIRAGRDEYRAVVLKNTLADTVTNVRVSISKPEGSICTYKLAKGEMIYRDKYGHHYMENILSPNNKPFSAQFQDIESGAVSLGNLAPGEEVGIWFCRHVDKVEAKKQYNDICEPDPNDPTGRRFKLKEHPTEEGIDFSIIWD